MVSPLRPSRFCQYTVIVVQSSLSKKCYKPGALESQCCFCEQGSDHFLGKPKDYEQAETPFHIVNN
uniref:Uncharacterized protein n=1 Tax=Oryza brachyantha TaxID=4533 RepID=J3L9Y8_ORYBR